MDIIFLLAPIVVLLIAATIIVRRWRGWWRATAVVPLGGSALAVVSLLATMRQLNARRRRLSNLGKGGPDSGAVTTLRSRATVV
jgi:hypothetical protein